jgi:hypothetical protein
MKNFRRTSEEDLLYSKFLTLNQKVLNFHMMPPLTTPHQQKLPRHGGHAVVAG